MTDDTIINEPSLTAGEVEMLRFALDRSRAMFAWKTGGLDAAALNRPQPPSSMTLGGLIKHLTRVEDDTATWRLFGERPTAPWDTAENGWEWQSAAADTPDELYTRWREAVARTRAAVDKVLADGGLDRPAGFTPSRGGPPPNVRRVLVDLHDEYARHVGHADLFREAVDGLVGEDPPQPS
ncbi:DUF664 domain-containing protein [Nonomuraea sp. NN258]|uniref:mycothiol transferase n=1 Tax=Nonomuraea antri TaxID=2730852 RepID=UPI0015681CB1|nr:DUF664 domain-containing protein [Nonomuraea antri]NRQ30764.1 DUF664 domain-containing protein [Nonomuraea antri]